MRSMMSLFWVGVFCTCAATAMAASPSKAEYAIRWDPSDGGPKSSDEILKVLNDEASDDDDYEIQYFDLETPPKPPTEATAILRQRVKNAKKYELTFKYRRPKTLSNVKCPLQGDIEEKYEVDVSLITGTDKNRGYSYSCSLESEDGPVVPPASLGAAPKPCKSTMRRWETKKLDAKIEEWKLPGGLVMFEVSRGGNDTSADLDKFKKQIGRPLLDAKVKPSSESKTELGGKCPE
jgi:hypothetical protein